MGGSRVPNRAISSREFDEGWAALLGMSEGLDVLALVAQIIKYSTELCHEFYVDCLLV